MSIHSYLEPPNINLTFFLLELTAYICSTKRMNEDTEIDVLPLFFQTACTAHLCINKSLMEIYIWMV